MSNEDPKADLADVNLPDIAPPPRPPRLRDRALAPSLPSEKESKLRKLELENERLQLENEKLRFENQIGRASCRERV